MTSFCQICGKRTNKPADHVRYRHGLSRAEYIVKYPESPKENKLLTPENKKLIYEDKTHVHLQPGIILPINPESKMNISRKQRHIWRRKTVFMTPVVVPVAEIDTARKMAEWLYLNYGTGELIVMLYRFFKNKNFLGQKPCDNPKCPRYFDKNDKYYKESGRKHNCARHQSFYGRLGKAAKLIIEPDMVSGGFSFKFLKQESRMHHYKWWQGDKAEKPEYY